MHTKYIIAASVVLGLCVLIIMALVTRILLHKHSKPTVDEAHITDGSGEHRHQLSHISNAWKRLFAPKQEGPKGHWVPKISGLIKAGDEGFFTSTLFANLQAHPGELSLQSIYEVFAEELRSRQTSDRSVLAGEIPRFLSNTKRTVSGPKRVQSLSRRTGSQMRADAQTRLSKRMSVDLSVAEKGLARGFSTKRAAPTLVSMERGLPGLDTDKSRQSSWTKDGQISQSRYGSIAVKILPAELAALSIILVCQITVGEKNEYTSSRGAFSISLSASMMEDGKHQIALRQHKRSITQQSARGSGFSPLFAKHFAVGSLPYTQDSKGVHSILVSNLTLEALQSGLPIYLHDSKVKTRQSRYLSMLASSRELNFHVASTTQTTQASNPLIDAISALPFVGGLVPLASRPLIDTVQLIAFGGLAPARLLQRLDGLVDKVNRQAPHLNLFGPLYEPQNLAVLYRERERLGRLATVTDATDTTADKASRMQRYITLLERLMVLVPNMKPREVLSAVQRATKKELEQSYYEAVAACRVNPSRSPSVIGSHGCPESDTRSKRTSLVGGNRSNRSSSGSVITCASPVSSGDVRTQTLGKQVERILKAELPLSVEQIATVARLVIATWTLSVEAVAWEDDEEGFRVPEIEKLTEKMVLC